MLKEYIWEAASLLAEALLKKPTTALADHACITDLNLPCTVCGSCGADKRTYQRFCHQFDTCAPGAWAWCFVGCACYWC
jgi:hypothetical protein